MAKYDEIIDLIRREEVVLFVGAGCSLAAGAPSASDLNSRLKDLLDKSFIPLTDTLQEVSEALMLQDGNRDRLNKVLIDSFSSLKPTFFHKSLSTIPYIKDIVTTNYDSLIESSYNYDSVQVFAEDQDCGCYSEDKYRIYKIHGDYNHLDRVVVTSSDYRRTIKSHKDSLLWSKIKSLFATKHVVFIGYSLADGNFQNLIEEVEINEKSKSKQIYLISPEIDILTKAKLNKLNVVSVDGDADSFITTCISSLKESFGEDISSHDRNKSAAQFGRNNGVLLETRDTGKSLCITSIKGLKSNNFTFDFSTERKGLLLGNNMYSDKAPCGDVSVPAHSLTHKEMRTLKFVFNGLNVTKGLNVGKMLIGPAIKKIQLRLHAKKENVAKRATAYIYCSANNEIHIKMNVAIGEADIVVRVSEADKNNLHFTLKIEYYKTFKDLSNAIDWLTFICGFKTGNIVVTAENKQFANFENIKPEQLAPYEKYLEYCKNIQDIENNSNVIFDNYECFSEARLYASQAIRSYVMKEPIAVVPDSKIKRFSIYLKEREQSLEKFGYYAQTTVKSIEKPFYLCGKEYVIPQEQIFRSKTHLLNIEKCDDGTYKYDFEDESDNLQLLFSDKDSDLKNIS